MGNQTTETPALLIIDMVKDTFDEKAQLPIVSIAEKTFAPINRMIWGFRERHWPVVFSTDAFHRKDFIRTLDNYRRNPLYPLLRVIS